MKITTLPVYSKLADENEVRALGLWEKLPLKSDGSRWQLSQHQVDTYNALVNSDADVIFNTAMTGDGKSLAGQLPALVKGGIYWKTLVMYPTNELIADQYINFEITKNLWKSDVVFDSLNGANLDQKMEDEDFAKRGDALMGIFKNKDLILTNPDIFHYVMHQFYNLPKDAPDGYAATLTQIARQLTFDEFHIFDAPQVISVLNALLFMREISGNTRRHKFLFLSATPGDLMLKYLRNSGLKVSTIESIYSIEGDAQSWRKILRQADIYIEPESRAEAWIEAHLEDTLLPFFKERTPCAKGAIIVNSVASADRILRRVQPIFNAIGLKVEINTGLTSRSRRKDSYAADLLIGTSTVDVGVDFQINFLVFESQNAGTLLQRLGRLGRHEGYKRNDQYNRFQDYTAYALVPNWIAAKLFISSADNPTPPFIENSLIDRQEFNRVIQEAYPPTTEFDHYARTWGQMQTIRILQGLISPTIKEQYKETRANLEQRYKETYGFDLYYSRYMNLWREHSPLLDEALSFRGGNDFPCCVVDEKEENEQERFKSTDLLRMIASYDLQPLGEKDFYIAVQNAGLKQRVFEKNKPFGFFKLLGVSEERQNFKFFLNQNLLGAGEHEFGVARVFSGFEIDADFPDRIAINNRLKQRKIVGLLFEGEQPLLLKKKLRLPLLFPIYEFYSRDYRTGAVAFGRTALMLEARLKYSSIHSGGGAIFC